MGKGPQVRPTLCWRCRKAAPSTQAGTGCSWSRRFQPVPGWEAEATQMWVGGERGTVPTFRVVKCPEFEKG